MLRISTAIIACALLAIAACGGKSKKPDTSASQTTGDNTGSDQNANSGDNSGGDTSNDPNLQPVIYFEFDQSDLDDAARSKLEENADWLKADGQRVLTIEGHTDEVGTTDYNLALGERRAKAAKDYLVRLGVDGARVSIITYGEERPASDQDSLNRRSMFIATKKN